MGRTFAIILFIGLLVVGVLVLRNNPNNAGGGTADVQLGRAYATAGVDSRGCPLSRDNTVTSADSIYISTEPSRIPRGTAIFARLYQDGQRLEDTDAITSDRNLEECLWFLFEPSRRSAGYFEPGRYEAELFVNGNGAGRVAFQVVDTGGRAGAGRAGGSAAGVQLGRISTALNVDQGGCPSRPVSSFRSNENIYVAAERSQIPRGTTIFARLMRNGQQLEDADAITAEQDLSSCFWFLFEPARFGGAFERGTYEVDIMVNGSRAETIQFDVR